MVANVYVDAFNLYYGCLKDTPYKWLDLARLCQVMLPRDGINRIRYFTALVDGKRNPTSPQRQQTYLRALGTIPNLSVHLGHYLTHPARMPLVNPSPQGQRMAWVLKN